LATEFIKNSGYVNPNKFISNPSTVEPPEPKPDPALIMAQSAQMDAQANAQKKQADAQKDQATLQLDAQKFDWSKKVQAAEVGLEAEQARPVGIGDRKLK